MTPAPSALRRRAPRWGGWRMVDLAMATGKALALVQRESPVIGIVSGSSGAERRGGRAAPFTTIQEPDYGEKTS